jgi:catalase
MTVDTNQGGVPNYFPNSFSGPVDDKKYKENTFQADSKDVDRFESGDDDNFTQCGVFYRSVLNDEERFRLVDNIASHIVAAQDFLQV